MDPNRYWEIDAWEQATTQGKSTSITPPTSEEIAQFSSMEPPARPSSGSSGSTATKPKSSGTSNTGATAPQEQGSGVKTTGSGPNEAHGANLPRDTAKNASTGSGGSSGSSGSGSGSGTSGTGDAAAEPVTASSLWSQALRAERDRVNEAGGTMRDFRMPFEQHPQSGVFANYQAVAQPGRGPAVPNRMPGQPPAPAPFPQGPMPMANGLPQRGPAPVPQRIGAPPPGAFPVQPVAQMAPPPQQPAISNFSQRLQQIGAQPVMPQGFPQGMPQYGAPPAPPSYAPQMQMAPEPRPMQSSFGRSMPSPDFSNPIFNERDPYSGY